MPDPVQNALAAQPSNNLAYIGPTPRNRFMGGLADLLALGYKLPDMPRIGVPGLDFAIANRNKLLDMLGVGDVQKTADALSYGNAVGTGAGMTYRPLPETLGAAMAVAPFAGKAIRATEGLPVGASIKAVVDVAPQAEAMRLAQQRAALPVEQGGLGLPATNTAEQRAIAMGFNTPTYHATEADFMSIKPSVKGKIGPGVYTSFDPSYAERYAGGPGAQTMPLLTRGEIAPMDVRSDISDAVQAQLKGENATFDMAKYKTQLNQATADRGYSGYDVDKERLMFNPQDIRSRFAAFDPFRATAATAAAAGLAPPDLLAAPLSVADQIDNINEVIKKKRKK